MSGAKKILTRLCFSIGLCALQQAVPAQDLSSTNELVVIDLRPQTEREGTGIAPLSGKCNKDVFRIADVASDPLKIDVLKADLLEQLGITADGKTLTVLNWSIYYNKQIQKSGGLFDSVGIQGYEVPGKDKSRKLGSICSPRESAGGWYKGDELTSVYFPLVSEFAGTFGGKPFNVRVVYSPLTKLPGKFEGSAEDTRAVLEAVHKTAEALATAIAQ